MLRDTPRVRIALRGAARQPKPAPLWLKGLAAFFLLASMQAFSFVDQMVYGNWYGKTGDKITRTLNLLLMAASVSLLVLGFLKRKRIGLAAIMALSLTFYFFASVLWSVDPETTFRESTVYLFVLFGAIGLANLLEPDEIMKLLGVTCFGAAIASLALYAADPGAATATDRANLQGIFPHKNFLGQVMATGVFALLYQLRTGAARRGRLFAMLAVCIATTVACKSTTSLLIIVVFCLLEALIALYRKGGVTRVLGITAALGLLPVLILAAANPDPLLELIGKDPTLTGRTELWALVDQNIAEKPLLGWGYFAFWSTSNPVSLAISEAVKWSVPQAHNGLREMLLSIGVAGTLLFSLVFLRTIVLACRCLGTAAAAFGVSTLIYCAGIFMEGISESVMLVPTQPSTAVFFITGVVCELALISAYRRKKGLLF